MNGGQDLGGAHGFGPVQPEPDEPVFHGEWEKRAFALTLAMGMPGGWNIDQSRFARENRHPAEYLSMTYYQIWFSALETMLKERGLVSDDEIKAGRSLHPPKPVKRVLSPGDVLKVLHRGGPTERETNTHAAFKPGDRVRAKTINPLTHTRLPRYVRGRVGTVERVIGCHVFPDSNATGAGENPQWLYTVCFKGAELWGRDGDPTTIVSVDAWESYLEPATAEAGREISGYRVRGFGSQPETPE